MTKKKINKEEIAEDFCFYCKDGGFLRICDYKDCLKSYHPACLGRDNSFLEANEKWDCDWHSCFICNKASKFYCYCCPRGVCARCMSTALFAHVKADKGFCGNCLKLALLIEEQKDVDSDGGKIDFKQKDTLEFLFMEYWVIVREKEGLTISNLHSADALLKKNLNFDPHNMDDIGNHEENHLVFSDFDDIGDEERPKHAHKRKTLKRENSWQHSPNKKSKKEFIGWCSKALIEFLTFVGKYNDSELSQFDVTSIIHEYIRENKLLHPEKKKKVCCDTKLVSLLGRKSVSKNKIFDLLECHFSENLENSENENVEYPLCDKKETLLLRCKKQGTPNGVRSLSNVGVISCDQGHTRFASIVAKNIKCVYLKRSVVESLLKHTDSFEHKMLESFVRIKSDPNDYTQRNSHQLVQVTGINKIRSNDDVYSDVSFRVTNVPSYVSISMLSDEDFSEEECEDLRQKVNAGLLRRPLVAELKIKACSLHEDILNHWIERELAQLQNLIDHANEKGWRKELFEYMEKKQLLQTPSEKLKVLQEIPEIIVDINDSEIASHDAPKHDGVQDPMLQKSAPGTPGSNYSDEALTELFPASEIRGSNTTGSKEKHEEASFCRCLTNASDSDTTGHMENREEARFCSSLINASEGIGNGHTYFLVKNQEPKESDVEELPSRSWPETKYVRVRKKEKHETSIDDCLSPLLEVKPESVQQFHCSAPDQKHNADNEIKGEVFPTTTNNPILDIEKVGIKLNEQPCGGSEKAGYQSPSLSMQREKSVVGGVTVVDTKASTTQLIELSDDDDVHVEKTKTKNKPLSEDVKSYLWHCAGPRGERVGPFSLSLLKRWNDASSYAAKYRVWKIGEMEECAISLADAVSRAFTMNTQDHPDLVRKLQR